MCALTVKDVMWSDTLVTISPDATLKEAAAKMLEVDAGVLPVVTDGNIHGIITDRDIVIRAVCRNKTPGEEKVRDHMTTGVHVCNKNDSLLTAARIMKEQEIGRLAVVNDQNQLTGIVSFNHIFRNDTSPEEAADLVLRVKGGRILPTGQLAATFPA